jgi:dihydrofolate reductase
MMRELTADLFVSLDGFASGVDQPPYFGYFGTDLWSWVRKQLDEPHVIIMGRVTYQALAQFSASASDEVSTKMSALPKVVFSSTLKEPLAWKHTRVLNGAVADEIKTLKQQHGDPLRSIGSIRLVKSMVELGVVDRLRLMVFPLILGHAGREPIFANYPLERLELINTKILDSRVFLLEYRPSHSTGTPH